MIEQINRQVIVKRHQDPEPWEGKALYALYQDVQTRPDAPPTKGPLLGICVRRVDEHRVTLSDGGEGDVFSTSTFEQFAMPKDITEVPA